MKGTGLKLLAFQGWNVAIPSDCNPSHIEGAFRKGAIHVADMDQPRLALRWHYIPQQRFNPHRILSNELSPDELPRAKPTASAVGLSSQWLYTSPTRNLFLAHSPTTHRIIQILHQPDDNICFENDILPTLADTSPTAPTRWSLFDLACTTPADFVLSQHNFFAGDLTLSFTCNREFLNIRQISPAPLALSRRPLRAWLADQEKQLLPHYAPGGDFSEHKLHVTGLAGVTRTAARRKRFAFKYWLPPQIMTRALHDPQRDRLLLLQGTNAVHLDDLALSTITAT
ncbi:MAG TPA: hypothetical protein VF669_07735 [Tepidisphaeraceae bacterium]|jgi:hypothetical protein